MPSSLNGTGITFSNGTTQSTAATGTVSSVATGNGLSGGTITTTGTLTIACPTYNTVGSYACGYMFTTAGFASGSTFSAGTGQNQVQSIMLNGAQTTNNLSGTWRIMAPPIPADSCGRTNLILICRVS